MNYDLENIKKLLRSYLRENLSLLKFFYKGKLIDVKNPLKISLINLKEGDYGDGYNFEVSMIIENIMINCVMNSKHACLIFKVSYECNPINKITGVREKPNEIIIEIKDNRIDLKD